MQSNRVPFVKMNGIGNEIIVADLRGRADGISERAALALAQPGALPFDQIMEVSDPAGPGRDQDMRIINADGSPAQACGNGTRCVVAWLNRDGGRENYRFHTPAGIISAAVDGSGRITVDMGAPRFDWQSIPLAEEFDDTTGIELQIGPIDRPVLHTPSVVSMGNPHAVFWVDDDLSAYELDRFGPLLENHPIFPERANISIARVVDRATIAIRTWERGAGLTRACGSAACAALVCAARKGLTGRKAILRLPGGELEIEWNDQDHVLMSGPVTFEFAGDLDPATGDFSRSTTPEAV